MVFKKNLMFLTEFKVNVKLIFYAGNFECCTGFFFNFRYSLYNGLCSWRTGETGTKI